MGSGGEGACDCRHVDIALVFAREAFLPKCFAEFEDGGAGFDGDAFAIAVDDADACKCTDVDLDAVGGAQARPGVAGADGPDGRHCQVGELPGRCQDRWS